MAFVKVDETEPLEKAIKRFKRMVEKEGVIREYKMREYFEKPSAIQHKEQGTCQKADAESQENAQFKSLLMKKAARFFLAAFFLI